MTYLGEITFGNELSLDDASENHDVYSGIQLVYVSHKLHHRLSTIHHRVYKYYIVLSSQINVGNVARTAGMYKHGEWEGIANT